MNSADPNVLIVANSDDNWKALKYLKEWCHISSQFDIATAFFEIGSLLALDGKWQKLGKIRILMGEEVSLRTQKAFIDAVARKVNILNQSIEWEKCGIEWRSVVVYLCLPGVAWLVAFFIGLHMTCDGGGGEESEEGAVQCAWNVFG